MAAGVAEPVTSGGRRAAVLGTAASAILHLALFGWLVRIPAAPLEPAETVAFDLVEVEPKPPPAPPPAPLAEPPPLDPVPVPRSRPVAPSAARPPPAPSRAAPPPPNETPPEGAPRRAPVRIGVSMSSTTRAGGVAAPVGNTLYGELPREAPRPEDVKPYRGDGTVPPAEVQVLPKGGCRDIPRDEYPREAREEGIEGVVTLQLLVAADGKVGDVKVVRDPAGFGATAVKIAYRHCRFEPARRGDQAVATWITVPMRFELR
ncbi:MAG TPA: energy transducer TonB [Anaeromyxobacteraceae bacterium]|nr:energy transducer TonB [Anaeromyxobacteraceae bacterium]